MITSLAGWLAGGTEVGQDRAGDGGHGRGDRRGQAGALAQVGRLDRVHDQPAGHPVQRHGQGDRVVQAEAVRAGRPAHRVYGTRPVEHEAVDPARAGRVGADRVHHDGEPGAGPGLDQPGGLAVGDHQPHPGRGQAAQPGHDRGSGAVVAAELAADADHHGRRLARRGGVGCGGG